MTLNVNIKTNGKEENKIDYLYKVKNKIYDICGIILTQNKDCLSKLAFHNSDQFIGLGILQITIKDVAYFGIDNGIRLLLNTNYTWKDVYNKIKDIDSIEYNLEV